MSSTNRGGIREVSDYYVTPPHAIRHFMVNFMDDLIADNDPFVTVGMRDSGGLLVLDPCAGGDSQHKMSYPSILEEWEGMFKVETIDIRPDSRAATIGDYLQIPIINQPKLIITNPPFSLAMEIITKALNDVAERGFVVMLLRLNFLESLKRYHFMHKFPPFRIYVHAKRLSFLEDGKTDSVAYAHFAWKKGYLGTSARLRVIE